MSTYRGKFPYRIRSVSSVLRLKGESFAPLLIELNNGATFVFAPKHGGAPVPKVGQEIKDWLFFLDARNDAARAAQSTRGVVL